LVKIQQGYRNSPELLNPDHPTHCPFRTENTSTMRHFDKTLRVVLLVVISVITGILPTIAQQTPPPPPPPPNPTTTDLLKRPFSPDDVRIDPRRNKKLTLRQALELASQGNKEIQVALLQTKRSNSAIAEARAADALGLSANGSLTNSGSPVLTSQPNNLQFRSSGSTSLQGSLEASYNLNNTLLGGVNNRAEASKGQLDFDKLDVERVTRKVRADVITAYYNLQDADAQLEINLAAVKNAEESLRNAQIQEKAGLGTKFDVIRAEVQKATAEQDVVKIRSQQQTAQKSIAQLLNISENIDYSAADPITAKGEWTVPLENSIVEAYKNRPELKQQEIRRTISEFQAKAAENIPQYSLFGKYDLGKDFQSSAGFGDNYSIGARVTFNLLDGGAAGARSDQEKVGTSIAETQYVANRDQVRLQVEQAYLSLKSNQTNIATSQGAQLQAQESLRLARLRLAAGVGTQLDVINADTELTRAKSNYSRAIVNYNRDLSTLRNAVYVNQY
jgi:outer membrane protein TolC